MSTDQKKIELLKSLRNQLEQLRDRDYAELRKLRSRANMLVEKIFPQNTGYKNQIDLLKFSPSIMPTDDHGRAWNRGTKNFINIIDIMLEDLSLGEMLPVHSPTQSSIVSNRIFVVHGHDEEMKQHVARIIEKLGLSPIILHEQPNRGNTIIQKLVENADVGFAVVLLSGDDFGYSVKKEETAKRYRARQNVILELGFFLGKLGPSKVIALYESRKEIELPSDYDGVVYTAYNVDGSWRFELVRELQAAGYNVSADVLLKPAIPRDG